MTARLHRRVRHVFWFEDVYSNRDLVPVPLSVMTINGKPLAVRKVDASTLGNVPDRLWNSAVSDNPHIAHTETWYFKA